MSLFPFVPEATLQILHPVNIVYVVSSVVIYTLRSFSPETLVVRRVHHHHHQRHTHSSVRGNSEQGGGPAEESSAHKDHDDSETSRVVSEASGRDRPHRRRLLPPAQSGAAPTEDDAAAAAAGGATPSVSTRYPHRRHHRSRSDSERGTATPGASIISLEGVERGRARSRRGHTAPPRSHSAEVSARRSETAVRRGSRRSRSDGASVSSRHSDPGPAGSDRRRRKSSAEGSDAGHRRSRHRSGSPSSRSRRAPSGERGLASVRGADGAGGLSSVLPVGSLLMPPPMIGKPPLSGRRRGSLARLESSVASSAAPLPLPPPRRRSSPARSSSAARGSQGGREGGGLRGPRARLSGLAGLDVTRPAYLLAHVLRVVPVSCIHHGCALTQKLAGLRLMDFRDAGRGMGRGLGPPAAGGPWAGPFLLQFHLLRVAMQMADDYLEGALFLDKSLVVRSLRSRRATRQLVGWAVRLTSRTVLDTFLLSVVSPILLATADPFPRALANLRPTVAGMLRGLGCGCAGVLLQWLLIPVSSQLINRGVVTVYEAVEYVLLRRYAAAKTSDDNDDDEEEEEEEEGDAVSSQAGTMASRPESEAGAREEAPKSARKETGKALARRADRSRSESRSRKKEHKTKVESEETAEDVMRRLRHKIRKAEREEVRRRRARRAQREAEARRVVLRAIFYRVSASLIAQCVVEHPLNVVVELLRGRAMMHVCGLLSYYDDSNDMDALSWVGIKSFCRKISFPTAKRAGLDDANEIPQWLWLLRKIGATIGVEIQMLTECVQRDSGQSEAIHRLKQHAFDTIRAGQRPSAWESVELMARCLLSFAPLYYDVQLTAIDKLLGFYMAIWTRLTKT